MSAVVLMRIATGLDGPSGASVVSERFDSTFNGVHVTGTFGSLRRQRVLSKKSSRHSVHELEHCEAS